MSSHLLHNIILGITMLNLVKFLQCCKYIVVWTLVSQRFVARERQHSRFVCRRSKCYGNRRRTLKAPEPGQFHGEVWSALQRFEAQSACCRQQDGSRESMHINKTTLLRTFSALMVPYYFTHAPDKPTLTPHHPQCRGWCAFFTAIIASCD